MNPILQEFRYFKTRTGRLLLVVVGAVMLLAIVLFNQQITELFDVLLGRAATDQHTLELGQSTTNLWGNPDVFDNSEHLDEQAMRNGGRLKIDFSS